MLDTTINFDKSLSSNWHSDKKIFFRRIKRFGHRNLFWTRKIPNFWSLWLLQDTRQFEGHEGSSSCRGAGICKILGVLLNFWCSAFLWSKNIRGAECYYLTYFKKYWGCYSTYSSGAHVMCVPIVICNIPIFFWKKNYVKFRWLNFIDDQPPILPPHPV